MARDEVAGGLQVARAGAWEAQEAASRGDGAGARRIASAAKGCRAQVGELELAVGAMERDPGRFGLSPPAVAARRREVAELGAKCDRLLAEARGMVAEAEEVQRSTAAYGAPDRGGSAGADAQFVRQQQLIREQDGELDELGRQVELVGRMGKEIGGELDLQANLIGELNDDLDHTQGRLAAATSTVQRLLKKNGKFQCAAIAFLVVVLVILVWVAFK